MALLCATNVLVVLNPSIPLVNCVLLVTSPRMAAFVNLVLPTPTRPTPVPARALLAVLVRRSSTELIVFAARQVSSLLMKVPATLVLLASTHPLPVLPNVILAAAVANLRPTARTASTVMLVFILLMKDLV